MFFQVFLLGEWVDYPKSANKHICDAYIAGDEKVEFKLKMDGRDANYTIDFKQSVQIAGYSGKTRKVRPPWDMMKSTNKDHQEKNEATKVAGEDTKQPAKEVVKKEDPAVVKRREDRKKALEQLKKCLEETATTKWWEEEKLVKTRAMVATVTKEVIKLGLSEEEVRPLRDRMRKVHNQIQDLKGAIRVYCRTRPPNQRELDAGSKMNLKFSDDRMTVSVATEEDDKKFMYDMTFNPGTQEQVFEELRELIQSCYDGFNVTVFVYGQTGSGKTFTMFGPKNNPGVVMRAINEMFRLKKEEYDAIADVQMTCSMIELYCGRFSDLLHSGKEKPKELTIRKDANGNVFMENSIEKKCQDPTTMWKLIEGGFEGRKMTATAMNAESSRSHLFNIIKIQTTNKTTKKVIHGKLTLVDLAGSERVKDSLVEGQALAEAIEINKSLTTLGDCMELIGKGQKASFRNAPLTSMLQDSLGGTAKTLMFANLSPAFINWKETINTCQWAMRARKVENKGQNKGDEQPEKGDSKAPKAKAKTGAARPSKISAVKPRK